MVGALPDLNSPVRQLSRPDPVRLLETETIAQALSRLRSGSIGERIIYFYITDEGGKLVGVHIEQESNKSFGWVLRNRFPWLVMNIASGLAAAFISRIFDDALKAVVAIAFFIPLVLTLAESVAMQTVTMSLQRLHLAKQR